MLNMVRIIRSGRGNELRISRVAQTSDGPSRILESLPPATSVARSRPSRSVAMPTRRSPPRRAGRLLRKRADDRRHGRLARESFQPVDLVAVGTGRGSGAPRSASRPSRSGWASAWATCSPSVMRPDLRLPADAWLPGRMPAQLAGWPLVGGDRDGCPCRSRRARSGRPARRGRGMASGRAATPRGCSVTAGACKVCVDLGRRARGCNTRPCAPRRVIARPPIRSPPAGFAGAVSRWSSCSW